MKIQDLLQKKHLLIDLPTGEKAPLLEQMARFLVSCHGLSNADLVVRKILEREADMSTGVGYGIAIPHTRIEGFEHAHMVAARTLHPVEYDAIDDQPVRLVFMMASPVNTATLHAQILSRLSAIMSRSETREGLLRAPDAEAFLQVISDCENTLT